jgi:hypothetical protein
LVIGIFLRRARRAVVVIRSPLVIALLLVYSLFLLAKLLTFLSRNAVLRKTLPYGFAQLLGDTTQRWRMGATKFGGAYVERRRMGLHDLVAK